uniref:Ovule protein n=1 Tax=Mesocestoides corti TaxID=53468 RepID=A0A5K3G5I6_MESCO
MLFIFYQMLKSNKFRDSLNHRKSRPYRRSARRSSSLCSHQPKQMTIRTTEQECKRSQSETSMVWLAP